MKIKDMITQPKKRLFLWAAAGIAVVLAVLISVIVMRREEDEEYIYRETQVQRGILTVGVTESGAVDIGTVEQTFDLDMSKLQRVETGSSGSTGTSGGMGGFGAAGGTGMSGGGGDAVLNIFSQLLGAAGSITGTGDDSNLTVSGVSVSVGQQVEKGDVLYELEKESVSDLEKELQDNVEKAKADLDAVYADQTLSKQTAKYTYESSLAYGSYAETEYNTAIRELQDTVENNRVTLEKAQESLAEYQTRLEDITSSYNDALKALESCQYSLNHTSPYDAGLYVYYYELTESAQSAADSLEREKEQLENNVEQAEKNVETAEKNYNAAQRELEQGQLSAKQTLALRRLAYSTAQETYDVTFAYLEEDARTQEEIYAQTQEKWEEFSSYISGNAVLAQYNGVITSVELKEGDSISTGSTLVTLYDMEDVSMTVTLYEEDMTDIALGCVANISFTAYPDELFTAAVTEISDASTDSDGNVMYDVTVTIEGDVSGLFQGMTGEITFVTGKSEETLYVAKRAVTVENDKSYVKVREEDGSIVKKEITAGFTDGTYIQILSGLSEGDIVLIESKVSGS